MRRKNARVETLEDLLGRTKEDVAFPGCKIWNGGCDKDGYGVIYFIHQGKLKQRAHRVSFYLSHGYFPKKGEACHSCDNTSCVEPTHLWDGTRRENHTDMRIKGRSPRGLRNGKYTHPEKTQRGQQHVSHKLSETDVLKIRELSASGHTQCGLASMFGVCQRTIGRIIHRRNWTHI